MWLAEQSAPVERQVALKVIKAGRYDESALLRFDVERQTLAIMDHHAIAKVFDAGATAEGQPYFVMEYVPGLPITQYCDRKRLSVGERLALFTRVCEGVQHAHHKAIMHRDLKPSNILVVEVDGQPMPRIIDFGIAKAISQQPQDETLVTRAGGMVGTPGYMSPEQVDPSVLDIDTRTDVYSLGVVLYELLTGVLPFDVKQWQSKPFHEVLRQLHEEDPTSPSTRISGDPTSTAISENRNTDHRQLANVLRGDLDWITLRALQKDRNRRYGTPSELAADINRYLQNEPVTARPASLAYRAKKYVQRHKAPVAGTAAVFAVLVAGVIISMWQAVRARAAERRADSEATVARATSDFLENDLLAQADASTQSGPKTKPDPDLKVRTVLDRAADRIAGKFDKQPEVEASIRNTIGQTYEGLGVYPDARKQLERALDLRRKVLGVEHRQTLTTARNLGRVALDQGKFPEAEALQSQALEIQRRVLGPEHPDTLLSMSSLAQTYDSQGKYAQAEALDSQALEIQRRVLGPEHRITLYSMNNLALVYYNQGKYAQAEALQSQALEIQRRVLGPDHRRTLYSMSNLASIYFLQGKYAQAEALYDQALEIGRRVLGPEHPSTLISINNLANVYYLQGKSGEAEALYGQALEIQRRVVGQEHPDTLDIMNNLAMVYYNHGKYAQAEGLDSQVLEIRRRVLGPEHPDTLDGMIALAGVYQVMGKYAQAEVLNSQALEIRRRVLGPEHPKTINSMDNLASVYRNEGRYAQAEALYGQTLELERRVLGPEKLLTLESMDGLAFTYYLQGEYAQAEALFSQTLDGLRHSMGPENVQTLDTVSDLALAYQAEGKFALSEALARGAVEVDQRKRPDDWERFRAESLLGASLAGQKKYAEAEPLLLEGYRGMEARKDRIAVPDRSHLDRAREWIVQLYQAWGKPAKAAEWGGRS